MPKYSVTLAEEPEGTFTVVVVGTPCFHRDVEMQIQMFVAMLQRDAETRNVTDPPCGGESGRPNG